MYNAMASSPSAGSKGSTRLHMDMADALNVMTYASPCPDGSPGCAAWDLFRAEDSAKIRTFLKAKFPGSIPTDPIHGQQVYLDEVMRKELADEQGVFSYRVYQRPGEAVFIPAGCAHQVSCFSRRFLLIDWMFHINRSATSQIVLKLPSTLYHRRTLNVANSLQKNSGSRTKARRGRRMCWG